MRDDPVPGNGKASPKALFKTVPFAPRRGSFLKTRDRFRFPPLTVTLESVNENLVRISEKFAAMMSRHPEHAQDREAAEKWLEQMRQQARHTAAWAAATREKAARMKADIERTTRDAAGVSSAGKLLPQSA